MRGSYFVIPTAAVRLESEATPVQHNAFQKRFDLCSSVRHVFCRDFEPRLCLLPLLVAAVHFVTAICSRSAGFSFTGSGGEGGSCSPDVCTWSIIRRALMCVIVTTMGVCCFGAGQRTKTHKHSHDAQRHKSACVLANYFRSQLRGGAADLEQSNMKDCSRSTYWAQAAAPSFIMFSASEGLERSPSLSWTFHKGI